MVLINGPNTPLHSSLNGHSEKNEQDLFNGKLKAGNNIRPANSDRTAFKKKKKRRKKMKLLNGNNDKLMAANAKDQHNSINNDLSYNVINSFSNDETNQIKTSMDKSSSNAASGLNEENEDETESEDDFESLYDNEYDDYYHNSGHSLIPIGFRLWLISLSMLFI